MHNVFHKIPIVSWLPYMYAVLPKKRARKKKRMPGEQCQDEAVLNKVDSYRINTFNAIMDRVVQKLKVRFLDHKNCYKYFSWFDSWRFSQLKQSGISPSATGKVCGDWSFAVKVVLKAEADQDKVRSSLSQENLDSLMLMSEESDIEKSLAR